MTEEFIDMVDNGITGKLTEIISATKIMLDDMANHFEKTDSSMKY